MSTATPTAQDWFEAQPLIEAYTAGQLDRYGWWHTVQPQVFAAHPGYSGHDACRVARIMAPFPLKDDRYGPR